MLNFKIQRSFHTLAICVMATAMMQGCGGGDEQLPELKTISVEGKLEVDGKPYGPAQLLLVHDTNKDAPGIEAKVKQDGSFDLLYHNGAAMDPEGSYRVLLAEDPSETSVAGVPAVKPVTIEIKKPAEGESLKLDVKMTSQKGVILTGGPDPNLSDTEKKGLGGI